MSESVECHPNPNFSVSSPLLHAPSLPYLLAWVKTGTGWADCWKITMTSLANFTGFPTLALAAAWQASGSFSHLTRDSGHVLPHLVFTNISQAISLNWVITVGIDLFSEKNESQKFRVQEGDLIPCPSSCYLPFFLSWGDVFSLEMT